MAALNPPSSPSNAWQCMSGMRAVFHGLGSMMLSLPRAQKLLGTFSVVSAIYSSALVLTAANLYSKKDLERIEEITRVPLVAIIVPTMLLMWLVALTGPHACTERLDSSGATKPNYQVQQLTWVQLGVVVADAVLFAVVLVLSVILKWPHPYATLVHMYACVVAAVAALLLVRAWAEHVHMHEDNSGICSGFGAAKRSQFRSRSAGSTEHACTYLDGWVLEDGERGSEGRGAALPLVTTANERFAAVV